MTRDDVPAARAGKKPKRPTPSGVLIVDKPLGPTSFDVVAEVRRTFGTREVGHAGTLDPMATGVLVVALGEATKLVPWLTAAGKMYEAHISLGARTDTLDAQGQVVETRDVPGWVRDAVAKIASAANEDHACAIAESIPELRAALEIERARVRQVPPNFAAIKENGERAYDRARRGEEFVLDARDVSVDRFVVIDAGLAPSPWLAVRMAVGKGYYVRSAARDLADTLGTFGHLSMLRRIRSGEFRVEEACAFASLVPENPPPFVSLAQAAARALPTAILSDEGLRRAGFGQKLSAADLDPAEPGDHAWFDGDGALVAVGSQIEAKADAASESDDPEGAAAAPLYRVIRGFARDASLPTSR